MANDAITRRLKIYVNGEEVDATITNLRKNLAKFRTLSNRAVEGTPEWKKYNAEVAKTELELKDATTAQKSFREQTKLTEKGIDSSAKTLSEFTGNLNKMFQGAKRGDYLQMKEGFDGVKTGIKGATKAGLAFIATPLGAAIAVLVGIGAAAKAWFSYNSAVVEALRLTTQITGLTDQAADQARIRAETLEQTFGVDFKETLETAKNVSQQFGISFNEAMDVIEEGLVRGQANNDEFFDSLKEYPTFFKQAGFSADEFRKVIETGYDLGIYNDKLPDALKEADLALKEQTKTTRDALINAFGAPFTDEILGRIKRGEITTSQALQELSLKSDEVGLNMQQNAQLTADVFKGAGEDAGGAIKVFDALNTALNKNQRELTESEQITQDQVKATTELKQVSSALFSTGDKGFGLLIDKAKLFGTKLLVDILRAGVDVYNWVVDLNNESQVFSAILRTMGIVATSSFKTIGILIDTIKAQFGSLADIIEGVFTFDFDKVKQGFSSQVDNFSNTITAFKDKAIEDAKAIKSAFSGDFKLERKTIDDFIGEDTPETTGTSTSNPLAEGVLTPEDEAAKRAEDLQNLQLSKEEENSVLAALEESGQKALDDIKVKYRNKAQKDQDTADKNELKAKKQLQNDIINGAINAAGQETKIGQALLAIKGIMASKEMLIQLGVLKGKAATAVAEGTTATAVGAANTAKVGFPQNIPLLIGFAAQAAGIITAIKSAAGVADKVKTPSFAAGGETGFGNLGLGSNTGGFIRGNVEEGEYVVPRFVRQDPEVPRVIEYLEAKRTGKETNEPSESPQQQSNNNEVMEMLAQAVNNLVTNGVIAQNNYTLSDERERQKLQDKLDQTIQSSKN